MDVVSDRTFALVPVIAAVVHRERLMLQPFDSADGVVARPASRVGDYCHRAGSEHV